jgi:hypothetical protein
MKLCVVTKLWVETPDRDWGPSVDLSLCVFHLHCMVLYPTQILIVESGRQLAIARRTQSLAIGWWSEILLILRGVTSG